MHTYKDLGSIKSSPNKTSESIKSEFTCCSISFARALVIGPILISLGLFTIGSSVYVGGATVVGMSSSVILYDSSPERAKAPRVTTNSSLDRLFQVGASLSRLRSSTKTIIPGLQHTVPGCHTSLACR